MVERGSLKSPEQAFLYSMKVFRDALKTCGSGGRPCIALAPVLTRDRPITSGADLAAISRGMSPGHVLDFFVFLGSVSRLFYFIPHLLSSS